MKKEVVKLIVHILTGIAAALTTLYLSGCQGWEGNCEGTYCVKYTKVR